MNDRQSKEERDDVPKFYSSDFQKATQSCRLHLLSVGKKVLMDQVIKLVRLVLVVPATNTISERSTHGQRCHKDA